MKYIKMLGLLAVAAAALMAFAGTASASTLTNSTTTNMAVGDTLEATSTITELHGVFTTVKCEHSLVKGKITQNGTLNKSTTDAGGEITTLHFSKCSHNVTAATKLGTLEINKAGEVFSKNTEIAIHTSVGECVFNTGNTGTKIGTLTGGTGAKLDIAGTIPRTGGSFFCGSTGQWTGNYVVSTPAYLAVH